MGGCNCLEKRTEEENEIKKDDNVIETKETEIYNTFEENEYENCLVDEKFEVEEEITNLESNIQNENQQQSNKFNNTTLEIINQIRKNPPNYAQKVLDNIKYIMEEDGKKI